MTEKIKLVQGDTKPAIVCRLTDDTTGLPLGINVARQRAGHGHVRSNLSVKLRKI